MAIYKAQKNNLVFPVMEIDDGNELNFIIIMPI